jgi:outer membrane protein OmpA-like peptidoglycan-associated protein
MLLMKSDLTAAAGLAVLGLGAVLPACLPAALAAQRVPSFGGVELRVGLTSVERATVAPVVTGEVDLGYVWRPELRVIAGLSHLQADIDREPGDDEGSFRALGLWLGGRYDLLARHATAAYLRGSLTLHSVTADAWDTDVDALLSGTNAGAAIAAGVRRLLDRERRLSATLEVRHTALNNIANTAVEVGLRLRRRGSFAAGPDVAALAPTRPLYEPGPVRAPQARQPAVPSVRPTPTDTAAARLAEAERLRVETVAEGRRSAELAERQARELAVAERRAAAVEAERTAAAVAVLRQGLQRAASAMRSVASVRETETEFIVTLGGNAFASGAATLSGAARREVRVLATVLAGYPGHIIMLDAHTDAVGDPSANQALSMERAAAARAALIAEGVDPLWTGTRGFGQTRPVATNGTAPGRAANRRVEIRILTQPCGAPPRLEADGTLVCQPGQDSDGSIVPHFGRPGGVLSRVLESSEE